MAARKVVKRKAVRRASTVSASKLSSVVERAAARASKASKVRLDKETILRPGSLIGRVVRDDITLDAAQSLADNISSVVAKSSRTVGLAAPRPAVMILDKRILVGFIDERIFDFRINM